MQEILQFQLVQISYNEIRINLVVKDGINTEPLKRKIVKDFRDSVDVEFDYSFRILPMIKPDSTGKIKTVISEIHN